VTNLSLEKPMLQDGLSKKFYGLKLNKKQQNGFRLITI